MHPPLPPSAKRRHSTGAAWHINIPLCVNGPTPRGRAERRWGGYGPSPPRPCFDRDSGTSVVTASSRYCALRYCRQRAKPWRRMYVALQPAERPLDVLRKACGGITALVRGERPAPLPKDPVPPLCLRYRYSAASASFKTVHRASRLLAMPSRLFSGQR